MVIGVTGFLIIILLLCNLENTYFIYVFIFGELHFTGFIFNGM